MATGSVKDVENYLTPSEAGRLLGTSGNWVKQLVRRGELQGVETHLGWLIEPESVQRLANKRLANAERKVSTLRAASQWSQDASMNSSVSGRSAHGKSLRSKSRES